MFQERISDSCGRISRGCRRGVSITEVLVCLLVTALVIALCVPAVLASRESARAARCRQNLVQIGRGLESYHSAYGMFPAAAIWKQGPLSSLALHTAKRIDLVTYDNWALMLLPHLDQMKLASQWNPELPIGNAANASVRTTSLPAFSCPADSFNRRDNLYQLSFPQTSAKPIAFARGNYGFNGGTHNGIATLGSTAAPGGDLPTLILDEKLGQFRFLGSGPGGINWSLSRDELTNGRSTLIMVDELRSGIDPLDGRGVWAFGQIGGSITSSHGINGDDFAPNHQWSRADDILGCKELHQRLGTEALMAARMPCVDYVDANQQATARSQHSGGVHALFADGQAKFIADAIDPGLWHVLHSRETPSRMFSEERETLLKRTNDETDAQPTPTTRWPAGTPDVLTNSLGMEFVLIPAGTFEMGVPDQGFGPAPTDNPPHRVQITNPYFLGRMEVTQQQFEAILHRNPSHHTTEITSAQTTADFPVEQVSWEDAKSFCDELSSVAEERSIGRRYRLPTEAEWEYACRSGSEEPHALPEPQSKAQSTGEAAGVHLGMSVGPVGHFPPNPFGLKDMRGNVWEWCSDWFDRNYYKRSPVADPQGPATGYLKVVRGNDWIFVGEHCMINYPIMPPWKRSPYVGFRVVCERTSERP